VVLRASLVRIGILLLAAGLVGVTAASAVAGAATPARSTVPGAGAATSSVSPTSPTVSPAVTAKRDDGALCATFRAAFAARLGVSEAELQAAARDAELATIDRAVTDGTVTGAAAERLKKRLATAAPDGGCRALAGGRATRPTGAGRARALLTSAAEALGMEPADLRRELRSGKKLQAIASQRAVEYSVVTAAIVTAVKRDLDAAVEATTLTRARADAILDRLSKALADGRLGRARQAKP